MAETELEPMETMENQVIPSLETVSNVTSTPNTTSATDPGEYPCDQCDFVAKNKLGLAKHKSARHGHVSTKKKAAMEKENAIQNGVVFLTSNPKTPEHSETGSSIQEEDQSREDEYAQLKILERKFGSKLNYKSGCTQDTPLNKIKHERKVLMDLINSKCSVEMCYKALLGASSTLELASQHQKVKGWVDLRGLHSQYQEDGDEIMGAIEEVLSQHPGVLKSLSPEVKLGLILSAGALGVAAKNKKKPTPPPDQDIGQPVLSS